MTRPAFAHILRSVAKRSFWRVCTDLGGPARNINLRTGKVPPFQSLHVGRPIGDAMVGSELLEGHFNYVGQLLDIGAQGDPWPLAAPSERFAFWLHSFSWLPDLVCVNDPRSIVRARFLVDRWIAEYGEWNDYAWDNDILANRLFNWLSVWTLALAPDSHGETAAARRISVVRQLKRLRKTYSRTPPGLPKFKAAAVLALGGAYLSEKSDGFLGRGLDWLTDQIDIQIFPDGGHISRSPQQCIDALLVLRMLDKALEARGVPAPKEMQKALDRLRHIVPFFSFPDGGHAAFHGSGEGNKIVLRALAQDAFASSKPFVYCPQTGYQRIEQNGTVMIVDTGRTSPHPYDEDAHLSPLSFELANDSGRLIVNCGWSPAQPLSWRQATRMTAAHSALVLNDQSCGEFIETGLGAKVLGHVVKRGVETVKSARKEQPSGVWLEAAHNGYVSATGLQHRRKLYMKNTGLDIRGEDSLLVPIGASPLSRAELPFDIRFHLHPSVRATLAQDMQSALLIQPNHAGWRFRTDGGPMRIEESVYLADGHRPVKTQQIVISGRAYADSDGETRSNRVRWSMRRLEPRK